MDRGNRRTKRSLVLDGHAMPLGRVVDGANRHALKPVEATLEALTVGRPEATDAEPQPIWMGQG
jgi:putative transposase